MRVERARSTLDGAWQESVVGVEENDVAAGCAVQPRIARGSEALVTLPDATDPDKGRGDVTRTIGGPVVDDDDLYGVRAWLDAANGVAQICRLVVARNQDRHVDRGPRHLPNLVRANPAKNRSRSSARKASSHRPDNMLPSHAAASDAAARSR